MEGKGSGCRAGAQCYPHGEAASKGAQERNVPGLAAALTWLLWPCPGAGG